MQFWVTRVLVWLNYKLASLFAIKLARALRRLEIQQVSDETQFNRNQFTSSLAYLRPNLSDTIVQIYVKRY